jgi:hypothetical protein
MDTRCIFRISAVIAIIAAAGGPSPTPSWVWPKPAMAAKAPANPDPWPRKFSFAGASGNVTLMVYQPQVEAWEGNQIEFRTAVGARTDGDAGRGYPRTYDTAGGTAGSVSRGESYDAQTGQTNYSADKTAAGQGGSSVTRDTSASWGAQGASADRSTSVYNATTGQTKTFGSGFDGTDRYASANGENYRNDGSGWQKQTASGWQSAGGEDTSWADREQQARSQAQSRFSSFGQGGGWADRFGGGFRR